MVACAAVPMPDPARDVLGVVRLNEERIERKVLADRRSVRRGAYQRYARAVRANVCRKLQSICDGALKYLNAARFPCCSNQ
jgi:hypothetical protein